MGWLQKANEELDMKPYEGFRVLRVGWNGKGYLYKILGVNTYLHVGVGQVNLVQEDREKGGLVSRIQERRLRKAPLKWMTLDGTWRWLRR